MANLNVKRVHCSTVLPDDMAVDSVDAYVVGSNSKHPIHNFSFDLTLHNCKSNGNAESGEHLDAQSWHVGDGLLMIGTEDGDALRNRMTWLPTDGTDYPIEYLSNGFRFSVAYIPPNTNLEFHFILAYNRIECENQSEWFAVDIPHASVRDFPMAKRLDGTDAG